MDLWNIKDLEANSWRHRNIMMSEANSVLTMLEEQLDRLIKDGISSTIIDVEGIDEFYNASMSLIEGDIMSSKGTELFQEQTETIEKRYIFLTNEELDDHPKGEDHPTLKPFLNWPPAAAAYYMFKNEIDPPPVLSHFLHHFLRNCDGSWQLQSDYEVRQVLKSIAAGVADARVLKELLRRSGRHSAAREEIITIKEEYIEQVYSALKGFFSENEHSNLLALLKGKPINGRVTFLTQQNLLADVFQRLHKGNIVVGAKKRTVNFLTDYFNFTTSGEPPEVRQCQWHSIKIGMTPNKQPLGLNTTPIQLPFLED